MARLIPIDLPGSNAFVDELRRVWAAGDAAFPVDQRLPNAAREALFRRLRVGEPVQPGDALVLATSGTTGEAKGAVLTHSAIAASAEATSDALDVDPNSDRWLACLPLAHIGGLGVVLRAMHTATPLDVHDGFDAAAVNASRATLVSLVPAVLDRIEPERFRRILLGGSAIPASRPANATATYGLTETGGGIVYDGVPLPGVELRVADDGVLHVRGEMLLRCYRGDTIEGSDPKSADGWFSTGDVGAFEDGVVSVQGRAGDLIISGGENVWPVAVERVLATHSAVQDVVVVGEPDPEWGERVVAYVEVAAGARVPSLEELRSLVKEHLPAYCAPKAVEVRDSLPRTALGKVQRHRVASSTS